MYNTVGKIQKSKIFIEFHLQVQILNTDSKEGESDIYIWG